MPSSQPFFRLLLLLGLTTFLATVSVNGTQIMRRPSTYKTPERKFAIEKTPKTKVITKRASSGKVSIAYFTNWGIYGANFQPTDVVPSILTHILYSFADVNPTTGAISLTDPYADEQKHFATDSWSETGNNLYGCIKQLYLLKLQQRNLKVLLSIGGWTYSQSGHFAFVTDASARATFVSNAVQLIKDYGFDGIDLDFEFPTSAAQGQGFADLFTALRTAFTALATSNGDTVPYQLTAAVSAGPANYQYLNVPQMNAALDYWNLMAYDYAGSWLTFSDNQANLYGGARTGFNTDSAVKWYLAQGATASKITLGMPLYGRAFEETAGLGQPYTGIGPGTIEAGVYSYKALPLAGATVYENTTDVSSYSYDATKQELLSTDKVGSLSLVGTSAGVLGSLDSTQNHISYPNSKWDNLRNNFAGTTTTTSATSTPTTGTGTCATVAAWTSTTVYVGGTQATYGMSLFRINPSVSLIVLQVATSGLPNGLNLFPVACAC
ncbi:hypothetical protein C0991_011615 [Blastosporella zonata]|nr:hypothetical protein C0991_011615 [Blastosporella zonata]